MKICNGERPSRPDNASNSWHQLGLTEETWELMENCWKTDPSQRPNINQVIDRYSASKAGLGRWSTLVTRSASSISRVIGWVFELVKSSALFRERVRGLSEVMTVAELDGLLFAESDVTPILLLIYRLI